MADNIIVLSHLNPLKFQRRGYANADPYNTKYFEDWSFAETIRNFEHEVGHLQPWQNNDIIELCLLSNYAPFSAKLVDCSGAVVDTFLFTRVPVSTDASGLYAYFLSVALTSYPEGVYRLEIYAGSPVVVDTLDSEWFSLKELHENSVLLNYTHGSNDYDVPFESGVAFNLRTLGGFAEYAPKTDRVVFIDQPRNGVQLDAKSYSIWKLFIGDAFGVPDWFIERINAVFCCDTVTIDGKRFVANDGAQVEPNREKDFPLAGWSIELRPAVASNSKRFVAAGTGPGAPTSTLVYNIETRGFGPSTGTASDNTVQIIAND